MDWTDYLKFLAALVFVLALMGGLALVLKKLGISQGGPGRAGKSMRVIETLPLDSRRKAVILERENKRHLVILGGGSDVVVESFDAPTPPSAQNTP